ncbi:MAG: hypothetical protein MUP22_11445 [Desulfobacterales bacterium]|nr:hypothetical protein [Desulfobacterales bacterium]
MKNRFAFLICLAGLLAVHSSGNCEKLPDLAEKVNGGSINWKKGIILATGIKIPENGDLNIPINRQKALAAATTEAFDKLLDVVKTIKINNELKIESLDTKNKAIIEKIGHMVKNAKIVEQKYLTDGKVEVTVQMELRGGFAQLVLPEEIKQISDIKVINSSKKNDPSIDPKSGLINPEGKKDFFTGLIIDATGINARPSMVPVVLDENGRRVYGPAFMSRESAVQYGTSEYEKEISTAKENPRVGTNPLIVKGLRVEEPGRTNIIISNTDALVLRSKSEHLTFLKKCRVIIVIDELKEQTDNRI